MHEAADGILDPLTGLARHAGAGEDGVLLGVPLRVKVTRAAGFRAELRIRVNS